MIAGAVAWIAAGGLLLLGFFSEARSGLNGDSAWLLYVASRVSDGSTLYVDLAEVNPPLVVWLNLPLVRLARGLDWWEIAVYRGAVWAAVAVSLWLTGRLLGLALDREDNYRRTGLLLGVVVILAALSGPYFGQREHVALVLLVPWLIAAAARVRGQTIGAATGAAIGLMAAVGLALKPHSVLVAIGVALYVRANSPRGKRRVPPEQAVVAVALLVYAAVVMIATPEYLALVSRLGATYWDYSRRPLATILFGGLVPLTVMGSLLLWPLVRRVTSYPAMADVLGIATLGLLSAVVLQHKGLGYHYYPALGTALLALLLGAMGGAEQTPALWLRVMGRSLAVLIALPCLALFFLSAMDRVGGSAAKRPGAAGKREIGGFLGAHRPAGAVVVLSTSMEDSFPVILESGVPWGSRYPFMWFVPALRRDELNSGVRRVTCERPSRHPSAERALVGSVSEDLRRHRPELVFVRRPADSDMLRVDLLACFSQDSTFRRELAAYRPRAELEHFVVFERLR